MSLAQVVLLDIEGTTTAIDFVHRTLFPYSAQRFPSFLEARREDPLVREQLEAVRRTAAEEGAAESDPLAVLLDWIRLDRKHAALKALQGMVWREGFESGAFVGHLYPDVAPQLKAWRAEGKRLAIFSSGSVEAQKLLFGHSSAGDLTGLFDAFFDTVNAGPKREASSYLRIAEALSVVPSAITFLSDVAAELDAARDAGCQAIQIVREGTQRSARHRGHETLLDIRR